MAGTKLLTVTLLLKAIDEMTGPLRNITGAVQSLDRIAERTQGLQQLGENMKALGQQSVITGGLITASLAAPIAAFKTFEDAETRARLAYMNRAGTDALFPQIAKQAKELGDALPGTTRDFQEMAGTLRELGESSKIILGGGLQATAYLRVLLPSLEPSQAAETMVALQRGFDVAGDDLVKFIDYAQRAKFGFGLDLLDFAETARYAGPLLGVVGVKGLEGAKDIMVLAGAMSRAGIAGSMMGTSLREALIQLPQIPQILKRNKDVADILGSRGIQLRFFDERGTFLGMQNMIKQVQKLGVLGQQQQLFVLQQLFGNRAATAMAQTAKLGAQGFRDARRELEQQAPLMQRVGEVLKTFSSKWEAAGGTAVNAMASIGAAVGPEIKFIADTLNTVAGAVSDFADQHKTATAVIFGFAAALGLALVFFGALTFALGSIFLATITWTKGIASLRIALALLRGTAALTTGTFRALAIAFDSIPVIGWIALLVSALLYLRSNWSETVLGWKLIWHDLSAWLSGLGGRFYQAGANLVRSVWDGIKSLASRPVDAFRSIVQRIRDHLPFSPAKVGPLRDLHRVKIMETIAGAMGPAPMVRAMRGALTAAVALPIATSTALAKVPGPAAAPAQVTVHYAPQITLPASAPADLKPLLDQMMREHADDLRRVVEAAVNDYARTLYRETN